MSNSVLQLRNDTAAKVAAYTGAPAELVVDNQNWLVYISDGVTVGGRLIGGGSGGGSVTSVAVASPGSSISISGSPIVTAGTINIDLPLQSGLSAGSYSNVTLTVNSAGIITTIANGGTEVTSFNGRTGVVTPQIGDYTAAQVGAVALATVTAAGDLIIASGAGAVTNLPIGTSGQVLVVTAGAPAWSTAGAGTVTSVAAASTGGNSGALTVTGSPITTSGTIDLQLNLFTSTVAGIVPLSGGGTTNYLRADGTWDAPAGVGTVTSVALSLPSFITVSGSPVTGSGTLTGTLATQTANTLFAGPTSGSAAAPTFRALVSADIPSLAYVTSVAVTSNGANAAAITIGGSPITSAGTITITPNLFGTSAIGVVPASGGGTVNYLRADGSWASPPGTSATLTATQVGFGNGSNALSGSSNFTYTVSGTTGTIFLNGATISSDTTSGDLDIFQTNIALSATTELLVGAGAAGYGTSGQFLQSKGSIVSATWASAVTSVGLSLPSILTVSGSPVTTTGTLTAVLATQTANTHFVGPASGSAAAPTFRALVGADLAASPSNNQFLQFTTASGLVWTTSGGGTVTSVALSLPSIITVSGSPVTGSGTLTGTLATQTANTLWAGPASGSAAAPTFRTITGADLSPSPVNGDFLQFLTGTGLVWAAQTTPTISNYQIITTTGNDTITAIGAGNPVVFVALNGAQATETINFPSSATDGQVLILKFNSAITALTLSATIPVTFQFAPTAAVAGQSYQFVYQASTHKWF